MQEPPPRDNPQEGKGRWDAFGMEIRVEKGPLKGLDYSVRLDVWQGGWGGEREHLRLVPWN